MLLLLDQELRWGPARPHMMSVTFMQVGALWLEDRDASVSRCPCWLSAAVPGLSSEIAWASRGSWALRMGKQNLLGLRPPFCCILLFKARPRAGPGWEK